MGGARDLDRRAGAPLARGRGVSRLLANLGLRHERDLAIRIRRACLQRYRARPTPDPSPAMITGWLQARPHVARFGNQLAIMPFSGRHSLNLPRRTTGVGNPALMGRAELFGLVARQDGLVTDAQALDLGMAARTLRRRVRREGWARVAPGVLLVAGHPWNDRARVRASGLW